MRDIGGLTLSVQVKFSKLSKIEVMISEKMSLPLSNYIQKRWYGRFTSMNYAEAN